MIPQDDNIQFEAMPDWGEMFPAQPQRQTVEDKVYHSLYDELVEKCDPALFTNEDNFDKANQLYSQIKDPKNRQNEEVLITLRNCAISELGVRFSTKKKYDYLKKYFDVAQYTQINPYDPDRVAAARKYTQRLKQDKSDIQALEQLEDDAKEFIEKRKIEINDGNGSAEKGGKFIDSVGFVLVITLGLSLITGLLVLMFSIV